MTEPEYIVEDAAALVLENISAKLQEKLSLDDIIEILEIEFEFLEQSGIAGNKSSIVDIAIEIPIQLDEAEMEYFILNRCAQENIYLTIEDLQEILVAEMKYLDQLGLIDHDGPGKYLN